MKYCSWIAKPFEAVVAISEFKQRVYELFAEPLVQATSHEMSARLLLQFHPLRLRQRFLTQ